MKFKKWTSLLVSSMCIFSLVTIKDANAMDTNNLGIKSQSITKEVPYAKLGDEVKSVKVTSITLNKKNLKLVIGKAENLVAKVAPSKATNKEVTWTSSDESVATVDESGKVTAVGVGTAKITCTANDESGKSATSTISVSNGKVKVTSITLNKKNLKLAVGKTEKLVAKVAPSNATNKEVTWTSSDGSIATVDENGKVTAVGAGTVTITCTANDGSGKAANCTVTVNDAEYLKVLAPDTDGFTYTFPGVNVVFDSNIKVPSDWSGIKVTNSQGVEVPIAKVHTTIYKNELQMYCPSITDGEYTLFIPANTVSDMSGKKYNKEINFKFNVNIPFELDGNKNGRTYTFRGINIEFTHDIKVPSDWSVIKIKNSQGVEVPITDVRTTISTKELQMYCESITSGKYTLFIPAGTVSDVNGQLYNEDINIKFNVKLAK